MKPPPRILALEADADRARLLRELIRERVRAEVIVVRSAESAVATMASRVPDLILLSALLPPQDEALLLSYLRQLAVGPCPPVLIGPPAADLSESSKSRRHRFAFARRGVSLWPPYDPSAIGARINEALEQSEAARLHSVCGSGGSVGNGAAKPVRERDSANRPEVNSPNVTPLRSANTLVRPLRKRQRAQRWPPSDFPWLCTVQTPVDLDARVVNISKSGVLIESPRKLSTDTLTEFKLCKREQSLMLRARIVRSEIAEVTARGVKYHAAAVFDGTIEPVTDNSRASISAVVLKYEPKLMPAFNEIDVSSPEARLLNRW